MSGCLIRRTKTWPEAPIEGGDTVYIQQQNYSIEALNRRDQQPAPSTPAPTVPAVPVKSWTETLRSLTAADAGELSVKHAEVASRAA